MATDLSRLSRVRKARPAIGHYTQIAVAYSRMREVDENLAWARLGSIELDDFGRNLAWLVVDDGLVLLGNIGHFWRTFSVV